MGPTNEKLIIQSASLGMNINAFQASFRTAKFSRGKKSDYDPDLWKSTIQFQDYASAQETIAGVQFEISISFTRGLLTFLQYFGRPGNGAAGYAAAGHAYEIITNAMQRSLGQPNNVVDLKSYEAFMAEERMTGGMPDDRWVEAAAQSWPQAWIHISENAYGSLSLELRMGS
ncbi:MAG: hypothetical protein JNM27_21090 [Leptospirales bacterium]|nr:hypothetical protein [Leptospirales bacterium]